jgi:hypothetical protein
MCRPKNQGKFSTVRQWRGSKAVENNKIDKFSNARVKKSEDDLQAIDITLISMTII